VLVLLGHGDYGAAPVPFVTSPSGDPAGGRSRAPWFRRSPWRYRHGMGVDARAGGRAGRGR
jgi:hypothetical protein